MYPSIGRSMCSAMRLSIASCLTSNTISLLSPVIILNTIPNSIIPSSETAVGPRIGSSTSTSIDIGLGLAVIRICDVNDHVCYDRWVRVFGKTSRLVS